MYILIVSKDKKEISQIKDILDSSLENQTYLIANSESDAREIIDEKQISLAFILALG